MICRHCEGKTFPVTLNSKRHWKCIDCGCETEDDDQREERQPKNPSSAARAAAVGNMMGLLSGSSLCINQVVQTLNSKRVCEVLKSEEQVRIRVEMKNLSTLIEQSLTRLVESL